MVPQCLSHARAVDQKSVKHATTVSRLVVPSARAPSGVEPRREVRRRDVAVRVSVRVGRADCRMVLPGLPRRRGRLRSLRTREETGRVSRQESRLRRRRCAF